MPMTVNGFGTSVCGSRGDVGWGSFDGMEWVVAFMMPIVPLKAVHTFDWNGDEYRAIPIRWSMDLLVRTFLWRWVWGLGVIGVIFVIGAFADGSGLALLWAMLAVAFFALTAVVAVTLHTTDRRNKDIRLVLGAATVGHCDPAHFTPDMLEQLAGNPRVAYGTDTFAEAAEELLARGSYSQAMWAARLCVAVEDASEGQRMTNRILSDPDVIEAIAQVRKDGQRWAEVMLTEQERAAPDEADAARRQDWSESEEFARGGDRRSRRRDEDDPPPRRSRDEEDRPARRYRDEGDRPRRRRPRDDEDY